MVGSALYGKSPLYRFDVASTENNRRYVAFDSTGTSAQISTTNVGEQVLVHSVVATWDHAGEAVDLHELPGTATTDFLASFAGPGDTTIVRHGIVACPGRPTDCTIEREDSTPSGRRAAWHQRTRDRRNQREAIAHLPVVGRLFRRQANRRHDIASGFAGRNSGPRCKFAQVDLG